MLNIPFLREECTAKWCGVGQTGVTKKLKTQLGKGYRSYQNPTSNICSGAFTHGNLYNRRERRLKTRVTVIFYRHTLKMPFFSTEFIMMGGITTTEQVQAV